MSTESLRIRCNSLEKEFDLFAAFQKQFQIGGKKFPGGRSSILLAFREPDRFTLDRLMNRSRN